MPKKSTKSKKPTNKKLAKKPSKKVSYGFKDLRKAKTEAIYKSAPKPPKAKRPSYLLGFKKWFYALNFKIIIFLVLVVGLSILGLFLLSIYNKNKLDQAFYDTILKETSLELAEINAKKQMIGTKDQLIKEIVNYQSAPEDLQSYVIKDYYVFKSSCIVNGEFIGPTTYKIANVSYDSYAKILKDCNGEDQQIVAKVGGNWTVVAAGKASPDCNDVHSLAIPMGIAPTCTDGRVLYPNPNP